MTRMQALQYQGPYQLEWVETAPPVIQQEDDVIIRPNAVATCDLDWRIVSGQTPFPAPFILGHEFLGTIVETGRGVTRFQKGDRVSVAFQPSCGGCANCVNGASAGCSNVHPTSMFGVGKISGDWGGAFAERIRVPFAEQMLININPSLPMEWFPSASDNVADALRTVDGLLNQDHSQSVLIFGSYDSIPLYVVQIALQRGAQEVTYCTTHPRAAENARRLGANVEYVEAWPTRLKSHDITVCAIEHSEVLNAAIRSTRTNGHCTLVSIFAQDATLPLRDMYMRGIHFHTGRVNAVSEHQKVIDLISSRNIQPIAVDTKTVGFDQVISELLNRDTAKLIAVQD